MSKLNDLLISMCPDGIKYKKMSEIGYFYGGLNSKSKDDFTNGNAAFISYMNVYSNIGLNPDVEDRVHIGENERQNTVQYGDVLFTGSSETPDECGISSVLTTQTEEKLYLNSFCFGYRFNDPKMFLPEFTKHLFRSKNLRSQITRTASGVTRFNVSKKKMGDVVIPVPPLEVQREIAQLLDTFTNLVGELNVELGARKQQYLHYRQQILSFGSEVKRRKIKDICKTICSGGTPNSKKSEYYGGSIPWLRTQEVDFKEILNTGVFITEQGLKSSAAKWIPAHAVIVAMYGATVGKVAYTAIPLTTNQACCNLIVDEKVADYKYVYYWLASQYEFIKSLGQGSQTNINAQIVKNLEIPIPTVPQQKQIVNLLDQFDTLCSDSSIGLPAEIKARQKQYEYYRDKFLDFQVF